MADLADTHRAALRGQRIRLVFQAFHLLGHRSALENTTVSQLYDRNDRKGRRVRSEAALERVGLSHRAGFRPTRLSGGERQRVAIARALAAGPSLLLCDEPTGNLDTDTSKRLLELFAELHADGLTLAVITHDPAVAAAALQHVRMVDGRLEHEPAP